MLEMAGNLRRQLGKHYHLRCCARIFFRVAGFFCRGLRFYAQTAGKPLDGTGRRLPALLTTRGVDNSFPDITPGIIIRKGFWQLLLSGEILRDVLVLCDGGGKRLARFGAAAVYLESEERAAKCQIGACIVLIGFQKRGSLVVQALFQQICRQDRADALIVVRVKLQQFAGDG